ncbi:MULTISPECIES: TonB-dependent receptor [unclassified Myroides]|uniref:TonB-dependent receptor n=1 Tax=unclassified Myroides TaxID=2642485 RepID=UPI003D2F54C5
MKTLFGLLLVLGWFTVQAQHRQLSGIVRDKKNKPIEQVNVYLEGSFDGALSNAQGYFSFDVADSLVEGVLKLKHPHYLSLSVPMQLQQKELYEFVLEEGEDVLGEIVIKVVGSSKRGRTEALAFTAMDVVSTAGSPGNIIGAMSTLPGAQVNGEDGRLLIRGGRADESAIYVNGNKVAQPYTATIGTMPVRSKFNPFLFKGMSFSAGGYSAEFGDALSGILQLDIAEDIDPSRKDSSISTVGVSFGETHQWKKNSLSYHLNYLNLGAYTAVVKQRYKSKKPFSTSSGEVVYKREIQDGGYVLYAAADYTTMAYEQMVKPSYRVDTLALRTNTIEVNSLYFKKLSPFMRLDVGTGFGYSNYRGERNEGYLHSERWHLNQKIKMSYQWRGDWQSIGGIDIQVGQVNFAQGIKSKKELDEKQTNQFAFFFENQWRVSTDLTWRVGVRFNKSSSISKGVIEPRTLLTYQVNPKKQIAFSYGIFHQALNAEQVRYTVQEDWMQAHHYILNYTYAFRKRMLRAEVFYKDYRKLLLTSATGTGAYTQEGIGYVRGFDLFWKDNTTFKNFNYWITYTYLDAQRKEMQRREWRQPSYVVKHNLAVVTKYWINAWKSQWSVTYNYSSPRYFYSGDTNLTSSYTSSSIHNVSMSWAYVLQAQKIVFVSVDNIVGRNPTYAYQFNVKGEQPDVVQPSAKRFVYVGFMWTISADKKANQIENL